MNPAWDSVSRLGRLPWLRMAAWATLLAAGAASARLGLELAKRAAFPWDLLLWSESPFMTDMLKLAGGLSVFGSPGEVNSFVYSPGLEYLCYALLAPFGAALDVRFSRALSIGLGVAAALLLARLVVGWVGALEGERRRPLLACGAFALGLLLLFRSPTTSAVHPDALHILHAFGTLTLCSEALRRQSFRIALVAMGVSGLGIWTKQPETLACVGAGAALLLGHAWGPRRALALLGTGAAVTLASLACLLGPEQSRFYLFELPMRQGLLWSKLVGLVLTDVLHYPDRLLVWLFGAAALVQLWSRRDDAGVRAYLVPWLCVGVFSMWPSVASYLKAMGIQNNLFSIDLWWLVAALVGFARLDDDAAIEPRPFAVMLPAALVLCMLPIFDWIEYGSGVVAPNQVQIRAAQYAYAEQYDALVKRDLEAGRRILIGHGTMTWIRNGVHAPPVDRMVSALELEKGGLSDRADTATRLAARAYDRIYMPAHPWFDATFYGSAAGQALAANYREVGEIPPPPPLNALAPNDALMVRIAILEPLAPGPESASTR